jgi:hypothetical protein
MSLLRIVTQGLSSDSSPGVSGIGFSCGAKGPPARKVWQLYRHLWADCLEKMWEPQTLKTVWASMACNSDSFTFFY